MSLITLEHSKSAYVADFVAYSAAIIGLAAALAWAGPASLRWVMLSLTVAGFFSWSVIEYAVHRFILHGLQPFSRWHAEHHRRPTALIYSPTIVSALSIALFFYLPAYWLAGAWPASALTLGMLIGYLMYAVTHHATHHWRGETRWLKRRKQLHALHHHAGSALGYYGVTSAFWDHVFGSAIKGKSHL